MKALKILLPAAVLLCLAAAAFASGGAEGEAGKVQPVKISYWIRPGPAWEEYGNYIRDAFAKAHPNVEMELRAMPESDQAGANPFMIGIATGTMPNVTDGNNAAVQDMALNGGLVDLETFTDFQLELGKILEGIRYWSTMVGPDGKRHNYQLVNSGTSFMAAFNVKLARDAGLDIDNPPTTWDEYLSWARAMTKDTNGDGKMDTWGTTLPTDDIGWHLNPGLFYLFQATGYPDLLSKDKKATFVSQFPQETRAWLEFCKTIYENEWAPLEQLAQDPWGLGKVGLQMLGLASNIPTWKRDFPELEVRFFSHPKPAGKAGITVGQAGGNVIWKMNTKTEAELKASWDLLKFMNQPQTVLYEIKTRGGIPGVYGITLGDEYKALDPFVKELAKSNSIINYSPTYFKIRDVFVVEYNRAIRGKITIDEAMANTVQKSAAFFQ